MSFGFRPFWAALVATVSLLPGLAMGQIPEDPMIYRISGSRPDGDAVRVAIDPAGDDDPEEAEPPDEPPADAAASAPVPVKDAGIVTIKPDAARPDAARPDATQPDATQPDATQPDAAQPDAARPDASPPAVAAFVDSPFFQGPPGPVTPATPPLEPQPATEPTPKAAQEAAQKASPKPPAQGRQVQRRRARRRRPKDWKALKGTGTTTGHRSRWGLIETITPLEAAEARDGVAGTELEFPRKLHFAHDSIRFVDSEIALSDITDRIQASPEHRLVLIEGHTDATGAQRYNQKLSEARASAAREALIKRGVAPERLLAYGFGESRPASTARKDNRRVVFRLIKGDPAVSSRSATQWGQAAVVGLWGEARWRPTADTDADEAEADAPEGALEWKPMQLKDQLGEGVDIDVAGEGRVLLRFPDLSRVLLLPGARVRLSKIFFDSDGGKAYTALKLRTGRARVLMNPLERPEGRAIFSFVGGSVEVQSAHFEVAVGEDGLAELAIWRGEVAVASGAPQSTLISAGQRFKDGAPLSLVEGPSTFASDDQRVNWQAVEGVDSYQVEIASDVYFYQIVESVTVDGTQHRPTDVDAGRQYFWRVRAIDARGDSGLASKIRTFKRPEQTAMGAR